MNREDLIQEVVENLNKLRRAAHSSAWEGTDLSRAQTGFLFILFHHPGSNINELAHYSGVSKSAITQLTDPLVDKGLIERQKDNKDRRVVRLLLTARGQQQLKAQKARMRDSIRQSVAKLSDPELQQLINLHRKITN